MARLRLTIVVACAFLLLAPAAHAQTLTERQALQKASQVPAVAREIARLGNVTASVRVYNDRYVVQFGDSAGEGEAEVDIDILSGNVVQVFTGVKGAYPLARGPGSGFAQRKLNAVWLWVPLAIVFVAIFFDWRRPLRLLHFDLAAIALLSVSFAFFLQGNLDASVPLTYPTLVYLLVRSLVAGFRPQRRAGPLTHVPMRALIWLTLALLGLRIALTVTDTFVSDIGYASVAGADRITHGLELYVRGGAHFDTYGPLAYILYIPFLPFWHFHESQLYPPAAQAAAILWELITVAGLVVLGRRLRPRTSLGWALAAAWTACPFTALSVVCASNDGLVAALLVWAFVAYSSPVVRGVLGGAAAAAKIAPGFILPVLARGTGRLSWRAGIVCLLAAVVVIAGSLVPVWPHGGLREFYDTTIGFQLHRHSPFSIWTQHPGLKPLQSLLKAASLLLAVALAFVPRGNRTVAQMAALSTAVLVAAEIPLQHWFYLYVSWFLALYCVALFSEHEADGRPAASRP